MAFVLKRGKDEYIPEKSKQILAMTFMLFPQDGFIQLKGVSHMVMVGTGKLHQGFRDFLCQSSRINIFN